VKGGALLGAALVVLSSAAFATSGPVAKSLLLTGWSPGAVVTVRVAGAALLLLPVTLASLRGRWHLIPRNARLVTAYGLLAVAGCQVAYFSAVQTLSVAVALLLEYLGIVLVVGWLWLRHGQRPDRLTGAGVVLAVAGLVLVLDVVSGARVSGVGVAWGLLAGVGLAAHYLIAAHEPEHALPPLSLAGLGLAVGAVGLGLVAAAGVLPWATSTVPVELAGRTLAWWVPLLELVAVAAALAYAAAIAGARLVGAKVASFVGLTEVLFAVLLSWALLGELPRPVQLLGGVLILAGVVAVRVAEGRSAAARQAAEQSDERPEPDFVAPVPLP
jgi:drug/metabolite transporter (DMT)-like permease